VTAVAVAQAHTVTARRRAESQVASLEAHWQLTDKTAKVETLSARAQELETKLP